ncbi:MAG: 3-dehydroquinate synthase II [Candidatus Bathyarchaeia archaeon]
MKELWIQIDASASKSIKNNIIKLASQVCDVVMVEAQDLEDFEKPGLKIASYFDGCHIRVLNGFDENEIARLKEAGKIVAVRLTIKGKHDEELAVKAARLSCDYIILKHSDWKVIPLENIIAGAHGKSKLLAEVSCAEEAKVALETLELGADGILLKNINPDELMETAAIVKRKVPKIELTPVKIVEIKQMGIGARACVDTCDLMKSGEGILVGCQSTGMFLVEAEVHENPFVAPRPFRVNAGSISLYTLSSLNTTRYLSELKAGDEVLIVDWKGNVRQANVGRVKIEFRPLILIEAEYTGKRIKTILQNAETIRLVASHGSKSVAELKVGDEVLAYITGEGGRHFGILVAEERVIEK